MQKISTVLVVQIVHFYIGWLIFIFHFVEKSICPSQNSERNYLYS